MLTQQPTRLSTATCPNEHNKLFQNPPRQHTKVNTATYPNKNSDLPQ